VRTARTDEERERIYRFRYAVYVEEMGKPAERDAREKRRLCDGLDAWGTHLYLGADDEVKGCLRVARGDDGPWAPWYEEAYAISKFTQAWSPEALSFSGRLMVEKRQRGLATATALTLAAYRIGREWEVSFNFIHTAEKLVPFFEHLGFRRYKDGFQDGSVGWRIPMVLLIRDHEHLRRVGSPFSRLAVRYPSDLTPTEWLEQTFPEARELSLLKPKSIMPEIQLDAEQPTRLQEFQPVLAVIQVAQQEFRKLLLAMRETGGVTRERYVRYLSMQYHLTKEVQRPFMAIAAHPVLARRKKLRDFLYAFALEEEPHFAVAADDLDNLGEKPLPIPFDTELWWAYFNSAIGTRPFVRLGAACVLEIWGRAPALSGGKCWRRRPSSTNGTPAFSKSTFTRLCRMEIKSSRR
jgi:predicted GNAT family N-acyltransferase